MQKNLVPNWRAGAALSLVSSNATNHAPEAAVEAVLDGSEAAVERFLDAAKSVVTKRAYATDIKQFLAAGGAIPCSPAILAKYLASAAEKLSVATLERRLAAINWAHIEISAPSPTKNSRVKQVMAGIRRIKGTKQRRVQALVKDDLISTLHMAEQQLNATKIFRDRALLLIGFAGAFRRSELVGIRVEHITWLSTGIEIEIPQSKTDQEAEGQHVYIPRATSEKRCPVIALKIWLNAARITEGLVFRNVDRHGNVGKKLSTNAVAQIVKASVARTDADATQFSGHSLRAGYATTAAETLMPQQIMSTTRHKSMATLGSYIRPVMRRKIPSLL
ncbi:site-specific integrase [Variovorax sp. PCZ-1]|uniref:site-specific integrase n=1 Tax=Variovorax sp. PCZ-1 TaxID=2835533 RepID=UPI001BD186B1|nr:site-specific integrase [Variovorax sp. PCZ-1]MBS7809271.1 site-specific integrase [Variovorax sp. PCZ-1]